MLTEDLRDQHHLHPSDVPVQWRLLKRLAFGRNLRYLRRYRHMILGYFVSSTEKMSEIKGRFLFTCLLIQKCYKLGRVYIDKNTDNHTLLLTHTHTRTSA